MCPAARFVRDASFLICSPEAPLLSPVWMQNPKKRISFFVVLITITTVFIAVIQEKKRITFYRIEASPGETLYVSVPTLNKNEVIVSALLALPFDINMAKGDANNFLVQNVTDTLVDKLVVRYAGDILQDMVRYDILKIWDDLFFSQEERDNMLLETIQSERLSKIRLGAGDKPTAGVTAETKLETIYKKKYRIRLDHQILTDHGVFYSQGFSTSSFSSSPSCQPRTSQVAKGSD